MAFKLNRATAEDNIQVYRYDFFTGFMLLIMKLFML